MASELGVHGVRVNAVCPGAKTRLSSDPGSQARIREMHARGVLDDFMLAASLNPPGPEHVGALYAYLASDLAAPITGRLFSAFGGYVGLIEGGKEQLLAYRDHEKAGPWRAGELGEVLSASQAL